MLLLLLTKLLLGMCKHIKTWYGMFLIILWFCRSITDLHKFICDLMLSMMICFSWILRSLLCLISRVTTWSEGYYSCCWFLMSFISGITASESRFRSSLLLKFVMKNCCNIMTMYCCMIISTPILSPITTFKKLPVSVDGLPLASSSSFMA